MFLQATRGQSEDEEAVYYNVGRENAEIVYYNVARSELLCCVAVPSEDPEHHQYEEIELQVVSVPGPSEESEPDYHQYEEIDPPAVSEPGPSGETPRHVYEVEL